MTFLPAFPRKREPLRAINRSTRGRIRGQQLVQNIFVTLHFGISLSNRLPVKQCQLAKTISLLKSIYNRHGNHIQLSWHSLNYIGIQLYIYLHIMAACSGVAITNATLWFYASINLLNDGGSLSHRGILSGFFMLRYRKTNILLNKQIF